MKKVMFILFLCYGLLSAKTGNDLKQLCSNQNHKKSYSFCMGYIAGMATANLYNKATMRYNIKNKRDTLFIPNIPFESTKEQQASIVLKYIKENPDKLHRPDSVIIQDAFSEAFGDIKINSD